MTGPKDRPILFSGPMIRALIAGRKTQTRRILKGGIPASPALDEVRPSNKVRHAAPYLDAYCGEPRTAENPRGMGPWWCWWTRDDRAGQQFKVDFVPGQRLWVRETWATPNDQVVIYRADWREDALARGLENVPADDVGIRWRPSIFMPRSASRLTLAVIDVRVERLQDISDKDARAEGLACLSKDDGRTWKFGIADRDGWPGTDDDGWPWPNWDVDPRVAYSRLWAHIHGPAAWDRNPWVVAVSFSVRHGNIDEVAKAA